MNQATAAPSTGANLIRGTTGCARAAVGSDNPGVGYRGLGGYDDKASSSSSLRNISAIGLTGLSIGNDRPGDGNRAPSDDHHTAAASPR
jgi:hypothetical protein